ncbi:aminotransferase class I/II-fold pyridoxal phosphate-dependent enzyme [Ferroplasma sp.]|uniref:aminotransferase class I/II-fold pyridoxal phosphate-dependent enzyme n=1 Tax=Ferroplasma sp. TaxID=2591003 RepID=UPI0026162705|nr:aminotransferase class I/II-fold pyridoxal phosphate-dependent enzyme [Ferroplasma sp.]
MSIKGFNSRAVHGGELYIPEIGNVTTPIFEDSTYKYPNNSKDIIADNTSKSTFLYSRWGNPTVQSFEGKYRSLEKTEYAVAFSTGMGAITATVLSIMKSGDRMLAINVLYGQTYYFFARKLKSYGINVDMVSVEDMNNLNIEKKDYKMIYIESIPNPLMDVLDIKKIGAYCRKNNIILIVDATFASPFNQTPVDFGADIIIHSGTKYIGGHSDVLVGVVGCNDNKYYSGIVDMRKTLGASPDAFQAYLAYRGLKTLGLRMERHNSNGLKIAQFLESSDKIVEVYYPGLKSGKYYEIAKDNLRGFGGMISFKLKGGIEESHKFIQNLEIPMPAVSLGGVESLITIPAETTHSEMTGEERKKSGITDNLIRLSVGIEDYEDLENDLYQALNKI